MQQTQDNIITFKSDNPRPLTRADLYNPVQTIIDIYPLARPYISLNDHEDVSSLSPSEFLLWIMNRLTEHLKNEEFFIAEESEKSSTKKIFIKKTWEKHGCIWIAFEPMYDNFSKRNRELLLDVCGVCNEHFFFWYDSRQHENCLQMHEDMIENERQELGERYSEVYKMIKYYKKGKPAKIHAMMRNKYLKNKEDMLRRQNCLESQIRNICPRTAKTHLEREFLLKMVSIAQQKLHTIDGICHEFKDEDDDYFYGPDDMFRFVWNYTDTMYDIINEETNELMNNCNIMLPTKYKILGQHEEIRNFLFYDEFTKLYDIFYVWKEYIGKTE